MFRLPRLVLLEIISRESSSSTSEGFLEFIRVLNSMSFQERKRNISIVHILQNNTSFLRADVCKYRPEVGKMKFLKNPPKLCKLP